MQIKKGREDVGSHQGEDTLPAFVRKSSRVSGDISMSIFLTRNKAQASQICDGDIGDTLVCGVCVCVCVCVCMYTYERERERERESAEAWVSRAVYLGAQRFS